MSRRIFDARSGGFPAERKYFLDTNVWYYIYGQQMPDDPRVSVYSDLLNTLINNKSEIYSDIIVLSEITNIYIQFEYKCYLDYASSKDVPFKEYRKCEDYNRIIEGITDILRRIISNCKSVCFGFSAANPTAFVDDFELHRIDFNDIVIAQICQENDLILVTHDYDFADMEIDILTANKRIISSIPK